MSNAKVEHYIAACLLQRLHVKTIWRQQQAGSCVFLALCFGECILEKCRVCMSETEASHSTTLVSYRSSLAQNKFVDLFSMAKFLLYVIDYTRRIHLNLQIMFSNRLFDLWVLLDLDGDIVFLFYIPLLPNFINNSFPVKSWVTKENVSLWRGIEVGEIYVSM